LRSAQADHWPKASGGRIHSAPQADHRPKAPTPIEIGLPRRSAPGAGLRRRRRHFCGRRRPTAGRRPLEAEFIRRPRPTIGQRHPRRLKSASQGAPRQAPASANAKPLPGRRRPTTGRRPLEAEFIRHPRPTVGQRPSRRLKSASQGAPRQASASANAEGIFSVGAGRPLAEGLLRPNSFGVQADHRPKTPTPIEIGLSRRSAPGVGLRRRKTPSRSAQADHRPKASGGRIHSACRPTVGQRRPRRLKSASQGAPRQASASANAEGIFAVGAGRPLAEGPWRPNSFGVQADHRPKTPTPIEIGLPRRSAPGVGLRRRRVSFRLAQAFTPIKIGLLGRLRAKRRPPPTQKAFSGRRRPTAGRRPLEAEFIRRAGRPPAKDAHAD